MPTKLSRFRTCCAALAACLLWWSAAQSLAQTVEAIPPLGHQSIIHKIEGATDRLEMIANTSRILTFEHNFHMVMVNNPEVLDVGKPLSPNQVQVFAKKAGVTQINLFFREGNKPDAPEQIRSIDVIVFGDAQELTMLLQSQFPNSSLQVTPTASSVIISGFVDNPSHVQRIVEIAQDYHPKVINNLSVGGGQQVLLHVKVMEVSRTKLRDVGFDFALFDGADFLVSGISGLINASSVTTGTITSPGGANMSFGVIDAGHQFFGLLNALRQTDTLKILANPTLVTVSGRPAFFNVGGEFPILVPQSLGTVSIQYKKFGTQVDFVPIVLGNANIRLEVRPRVSEIDTTRSVVVNNISVPALRVREVDTGVELQAGQTLALAGLIQSRLDERIRAIPILGELPYVGAAFRRVRAEENEIELLILVTPQLAESMDCEEVPPCGPGTMSDVPRDWGFYLKGHNEVPKYRPGVFDAAGPPPGEWEGEELPGPMNMGPRAPTPAEDVPPGDAGKSSAKRGTNSPATGGSAPRGRNQTASAAAKRRPESGPPGLIGPTGYDDKQ